MNGLPGTGPAVSRAHSPWRPDAPASALESEGQRKPLGAPHWWWASWCSVAVLVSRVWGVRAAERAYCPCLSRVRVSEGQRKPVGAWCVCTWGRAASRAGPRGRGGEQTRGGRRLLGGWEDRG